MDRKKEKRVNKSRNGYQSRLTTAGRPPVPSLLEIANTPPAPELNAEEFSLDQTEEIVFALALAVEQRDRHTGGHCERLAFISAALGAAMGLSRAELVALYRGGFLHDVGKVGIPDSILFKPGKLNPEEWDTMRSHTTRGEEICRHMKSLSPVLPIIRHHHERWDGTGYPDGLKGEEIPLVARVLQIADIYDALTSPRSYKPAYQPEHALWILQEETDRGWRDPEIVRFFLKVQKDIIAKAIDYTSAPDRSLDIMRVSLANLQNFLTVDSMFA